MNLRLNILIILLSSLYLFLLSNLFAQQLPLRNYSVASGLVSNYIFDLMQDKDGFIWIATDRGVSKFDGNSFQNFTKADGLGANFIYKIFQSSDGSIWFGSYKGGATRYKDGIFKTITMDDSLVGNTINDITEDNFGRLYFATDFGISIYKDSVLFSYKAEVENSCELYRHNTGKIFFSKDLSLYILTPELEDSFRPTQIELSTTQKEILFMKSWAFPIMDGNTLVYPGRNKCLEIELTENAEVLSVKTRNKEYYSLLKDRFNRIWCAERNQVTVSEKDKNWSISMHNGLDSKYVEALLEDYEGNIWLGSFGGGLYKYKGDHIRYFTEKNGLPTNLTLKVFENSNGNILIGTTNGLAILKDNIIKEIPLGLELKEIQAFNKTSSEELYIGTLKYVLGPIKNLLNIKKTQITKAYYGAGVSSIFVDKNDNIWVGTYGRGLTKQTNFGNITFTTDNGLASNIIEDIVVGKNYLWLLSKNVGATKFSEDSIAFFRKSNGLISDAVYSLYEEVNGTVWFGTDQGVTRLYNNIFTSYHKSNGLVGNYVIGIIKYHGQILFITEKAIHSLQNNSFKIIIGSDILPNNEVEIKSVYYSAKNEVLWLSTNNGVIKIDLDMAYTKMKWLLNKHPKCIITRVNSDSTELYNSRSNYKKKLTINSDINNIAFSFSGVTFLGEEPSKFCYKLEGIDKTWSTPISKNEVIYRNLSSGKYIFRVKAVNNVGVISNIPAQIEIEILPPFWMKLWFLIPIIVLILTIVIWIIYVLSTRKLRKNIKLLEQEQTFQRIRQDTRERIAGELHDDVSSTLSCINLYADSLKQKIINEPENLELYVGKLNDLTHEAQVTMEEIIWALSPHHDTLQDLILRTSDFVSELCYDNNITCSINTLEVKNDFIVDEQVRKSIYLIFKETINNILKHSFATAVNIKVGIEKEYFILDISDNGVGFDESTMVLKTKGGNGLNNMKKRALKIGAEFLINSKIMEGTNILLKIKTTHMSH